ncbi:MAG TPA: hypothetical protein ENJ28_03805 [Gammaproteobacteria bacterium]|nr:hypothetical protein [Gammaproteobacteria bacterium]
MNFLLRPEHIEVECKEKELKNHEICQFCFEEKDQSKLISGAKTSIGLNCANLAVETLNENM